MDRCRDRRRSLAVVPWIKMLGPPVAQADPSVWFYNTVE